MSDRELVKKLEAVLFALGGPLSRKELSAMLETSTEELELALKDLRAESKERGIVLIDDGSMLELRASPDTAELVEAIRKEEFNRDIGRAGVEALAAILYRGPLTRSEIDFIRGVNSSQTLRTLLMRGLIRKIPKPGDERSFLYEPTTELLAQLGVSHAEDLPDYTSVRGKLAELEEAYKKAEA